MKSTGMEIKRFFVKSRLGKRRNTLCARKGICRIRKAPLSPTAAQYFKFFKPKNWQKRSDVRRRGFIQRFLKIFHQESHVPRTLATCERTMRRFMQNLLKSFSSYLTDSNMMLPLYVIFSLEARHIPTFFAARHGETKNGGRAENSTVEKIKGRFPLDIL